jgi:secondary thiamine-phosphate synthase enzyme
VRRAGEQTADLRQATTSITIATRRRGLVEVTAEVARWVAQQNIGTGLLTLFIQHTSASLLIQENADPDVIADLDDHFERLAPEHLASYRHTMEGPDDMPAHIRAALTATQLSIPVIRGSLALGTWQGIYVFEHRTRPHRRSIVLHLVGE